MHGEKPLVRTRRALSEVPSASQTDSVDSATRRLGDSVDSVDSTRSTRLGRSDSGEGVWEDWTGGRWLERENGPVTPSRQAHQPAGTKAPRQTPRPGVPGGRCSRW
jgi:hypothetical protein